MKVEIAEKYRCKECGKPADFRFYSEYSRYEVPPDQEAIAIPAGSRFQCEHGHTWKVPGLTRHDVTMDPEAEPLYKYSRELERKRLELDAHRVESLKKMIPVESGDALRLLFQIQEALPEAGIASGLHLGVEILLKNFKEQKQRIDDLYEALEEAHSVDRCPYNDYDGCKKCQVIKAERKRRKEGK